MEVKELRKPITAIDILRKHQMSIDHDGVVVGVSRQALDEVLTEYDSLVAKQKGMVLVPKEELQRWVNTLKARESYDYSAGLEEQGDRLLVRIETLIARAKEE